MRTVLIAPSTWTLVDSSAHHDRFAIDAFPRVVVEVEHPSADLARPLERRAPAEELRQLSVRDVTTACGWEYRLWQLELVGPDRTVREHRLVALYHFLDVVSLVTASSDSAADLSSCSDEILGVMGTARPRWRGAGAASLAELMEISAGTIAAPET